MPAGFQTFDENGNVILDLTTRTVKFLGRVYSGTTPGTIYVPGFAEGTPFWLIVPRGTTGPYFDPAQVYLSNGNLNLNWTFPKDEVAPPYKPRYTSVASDIFYGIF